MQTLALGNPLDSLELKGIAYAGRFARTLAEVQAAQALRYEVFNRELGEGLDQSHHLARDEDRFDFVCDHLVVEHLDTMEIVGTYRLQPGNRAVRQLGFYCSEEFDLRRLAPLCNESVELGRACVHPAHRSLAVLVLLWKGIAAYARCHGAKYLFGCSSLSSQVPAVGASVYTDLCRRHLSLPSLRAAPRPGFECPLDQLCEEPQIVPKLLRAYLNLGAKICGPPALDRSFKTIDFLTLLNLDTLPEGARDRFDPSPAPGLAAWP